MTHPLPLRPPGPVTAASHALPLRPPGPVTAASHAAALCLLLLATASRAASLTYYLDGTTWQASPSASLFTRSLGTITNGQSIIIANVTNLTDHVLSPGTATLSLSVRTTSPGELLLRHFDYIIYPGEGIPTIQLTNSRAWWIPASATNWTVVNLPITIPSGVTMCGNRILSVRLAAQVTIGSPTLYIGAGSNHPTSLTFPIPVATNVTYADSAGVANWASNLVGGAGSASPGYATNATYSSESGHSTNSDYALGSSWAYRAEISSNMTEGLSNQWAAFLERARTQAVAIALSPRMTNYIYHAGTNIVGMVGSNMFWGNSYYSGTAEYARFKRGVYIGNTNATAIYDDGPNKLIGSLQTATRRGSTGEGAFKNACWSFLSPNTYIEVPHTPLAPVGNNSWTLSFWIYGQSDNAFGGGDFLHFGTLSTAGQLAVRRYGNQMTLQGSGGVGYITRFSPAAEKGVWMHVAIINSSGVGRVSAFTNAAFAANFAITFNVDDDCPLKMGGPVLTPGIRLDEVSVWNSLLSEEQITNLYNAGAGQSLVGNEGGLVEYFTFDHDLAFENKSVQLQVDGNAYILGNLKIDGQSTVSNDAATVGYVDRATNASIGVAYNASTNFTDIAMKGATNETFWSSFNKGTTVSSNLWTDAQNADNGIRILASNLASSASVTPYIYTVDCVAPTMIVAVANGNVQYLNVTHQVCWVILPSTSSNTSETICLEINCYTNTVVFSTTNLQDPLTTTAKTNTWSVLFRSPKLQHDWQGLQL